jgi:hypothetical protein
MTYLIDLHTVAQKRVEVRARETPRSAKAVFIAEIRYSPQVPTKNIVTV